MEIKETKRGSGRGCAIAMTNLNLNNNPASLFSSRRMSWKTSKKERFTTARLHRNPLETGAVDGVSPIRDRILVGHPDTRLLRRSSTEVAGISNRAPVEVLAGVIRDNNRILTDGPKTLAADHLIMVGAKGVKAPSADKEK